MTELPNAASVALVRGKTVLLIKRAFAPYQHLWTLPGGRLEANESIEACARREIAEELGLTVGELKPVMVQSLGRDESFRLAVFATTDFSGAIVTSNEINDYKWLEMSALPALRTTSRLDDVLARAFAAVAQS